MGISSMFLNAKIVLRTLHFRKLHDGLICRVHLNLYYFSFDEQEFEFDFRTFACANSDYSEERFTHIVFLNAISPNRTPLAFHVYGIATYTRVKIQHYSRCRKTRLSQTMHFILTLK